MTSLLVTAWFYFVEIGLELLRKSLFSCNNIRCNSEPLSASSEKLGVSLTPAVNLASVDLHDLIKLLNAGKQETKTIRVGFFLQREGRPASLTFSQESAVFENAYFVPER